MKHICNNCGKQKSINNPVFLFEDEKQSRVTLCRDCYNSTSEEYKLTLKCLSGKERVSGIPLGIVGYIASKEGARMENESFKRKFEITNNELDKWSIKKFNEHYLLLSAGEQSSIMGDIAYWKRKNIPEFMGMSIISLPKIAVGLVLSCLGVWFFGLIIFSPLILFFCIVGIALCVVLISVWYIDFKKEKRNAMR